MPKFVLPLLLAIFVTGADAQTLFKCIGDDGKIEISDRACDPVSRSEKMPDRAPITQQQRYEAQQRAQRLQDEAANGEASSETAKSVAASAQKTEDQGQAAAAANTAADDENAIANCVRDVERRGASQDVKAEMIAACRTAGQVQRSSGMSSDAVSECVKRVERTGASEMEKARQLAMCHGGDVQPEHLRASNRKRSQ